MSGYGKLLFKGDKPKPKKNKKRKSTNEGETSEQLQEDGWILVKKLEDLQGPISLLQRITASKIKKEKLPDDNEGDKQIDIV